MLSGENGGAICAHLTNHDRHRVAVNLAAAKIAIQGADCAPGDGAQSEPAMSETGAPGAGVRRSPASRPASEGTPFDVSVPAIERRFGASVYSNV